MEEMTIATEHNSPATLSALVAVQQLSDARTRERRVRGLLWLWCAAILVWLLPVAPWSATGLSTGMAVLAGAGLLLVGGALMVLYTLVSRSAVIGTSLDASPAGAVGIQPLDKSWLFGAGASTWSRAAVPIVAAVLLLSPVVWAVANPDVDRNSVWLLYPLAGLLLALRWQMRGAIAGIVLALGLFALVELTLYRAEAFADEAGISFLVTTVVLTVLVPLTVAWLMTGLHSETAVRRVTEARLRNVQDSEEMIRRSEQRFRALVQHAGDSVAVIDADGTRRYVSPSIARLLGYQPEELLGTSFFTGIHPEDVERVVDWHVQTLQEPEERLRIEFRRATRDGAWRILEAVAHNLIADPSVAGIEVICRDITERRQAEDVLRSSEERFRALVQNASDVIVVLNIDGSVQYVSESVRRVLGYEPEEQLGTDAFAYVHPDDADRLRQSLSLVAQRPGAHRPTEFRLRHADGSWRDMEASATNLLHDPRVRGIVQNVRDVTERKRAEAALAESAQRLQAQKTELEGILTHLGDGLMLATADGRVTMINPAARALLGIAAHDAAAGRMESEYWHALTPDGTAVTPDGLPLARALAGERTTPYDVAVLVDGEARLISVSAAPLRTPAGLLHGAVAVLRDVTEVRRTQERIMESERLSALGQMASGVAHDFNNLLAVILGRCELLLGPAPSAARAWNPSQHLEVVKQAALDGAETVKRLQAFSGVSRVLSEEAMDLGSILRDVVQFARPRWKDGAQQRGITIHMDVDVEPMPAVAGSPSELREVLLNLVFNAVDAMPHGGTIRLSARRAGDNVELAVADNGVGMTEAVRRRIFEPFFTTKGTRGAGLGLSMSFGIISRMGGRIDVESAPNAGTSFTIRLPFRPMTASTKPAAGPATRSLSLLVVDDEPEVLRTAQLLLELDGHHVTTATGGVEALLYLQESGGEHGYDALLTDLGMPGMNGMQLVAAARDAGHDLPCLLVTGWGMELSTDDVAAAGIQGVVSKPFTSAQIRAALAGVTSGRAVVRPRRALLA